MRVKALVLFVVTLALAASAWAAGTETLLYSFCAQTSCVDGNQPYGALIADAKGTSLWHDHTMAVPTTWQVYELTNSGGTWTETVIYSFLGASNNDGAYPFSGLVFDTAGNLYGMTY